MAVVRARVLDLRPVLTCSQAYARHEPALGIVRGSQWAPYLHGGARDPDSRLPSWPRPVPHTRGMFLKAPCRVYQGEKALQVRVLAILRG